VLLGFLLLLVIVSSFALLKDMNSMATNVERDHQTMRTLAEAKAALITWAVSHPANPGMLPFPDGRNDLNYDGTSDCPTAATFSNALLLGRFPWRGDINPNNPCAAPHTGISVDLRDGAGEALWYAVSRNLVHRGSAPVCASTGWPNTGLDALRINPSSAINSRWITVRNANGTLRSNRVAFVVLAPGPPVGNQNRNGTAPPANRYLDSVTVSGTTYSNSDTPSSATAPFDFIIYPDSDTTPQAGDRFNDVLIYVTIDELLREVEKRAVAQASKELREFFRTNNYYPFPADLGGASAACDASNLTGFLPMTAGSCTGSSTLSFTQAPWFTCQKWNEHIYYAVAPACTGSTLGCSGVGFLTSGVLNNMKALVIGAGPSIVDEPYALSKGAPQTRPSVNVNDYLDDEENAAGDPNVYDPPGTPRTNSYNDQVSIVPP
jgi:hypothetical protein